MRASTPPMPDEYSRNLCRDAIERFLDRSWMLERVPLPAIEGNRHALTLLDDWMRRHRVVPLIDAGARDVRALLRSKFWDIVSRRYEALLGLVTRFYQSLRDNRFRADDPVETLIDEELAAAASHRKAARRPSRQSAGGKPLLRRGPVL